MKVRYLLFLIIILCCSGCSVDYHLDINDKVLDENIKMSATTGVDLNEFRDFKWNLPIDIRADDISVYEKKAKDIKYYDFSKSEDTMNFHYAYDVEKFRQGMFLRRCYEFVNIIDRDNKKKKELLLSTSDKLLCFDKYDNLDDVRIVITSKYKLKDTNADEVLKHKYIWNINKSNYDEKYIYLLLDTSVKELSIWDKILDFNMFTVSVILLLVGFILYIFFKKKSEFRDRI